MSTDPASFEHQLRQAEACIRELLAIVDGCGVLRTSLAGARPTRDHRGHTAALLPAGGDELPPPCRKGWACEAPRPACGPGRPGTVPPG